MTKYMLVLIVLFLFVLSAIFHPAKSGETETSIALDIATGPYLGIGIRDDSIGWHLKATDEFLIAGFSKAIQTDYGLFQVGGGPAMRDYTFDSESNEFDKYPSATDRALGLALFVDYSYLWFFSSINAIYSEHDVTRKRISGFRQETGFLCNPICQEVPVDLPNYESAKDEHSGVDWFLNVGLRWNF